jgi:hypothetical protein
MMVHLPLTYRRALSSPPCTAYPRMSTVSASASTSASASVSHPRRRLHRAPRTTTTRTFAHRGGEGEGGEAKAVAKAASSSRRAFISRVPFSAAAAAIVLEESALPAPAAADENGPFCDFTQTLPCDQYRSMDRTASG